MSDRFPSPRVRDRLEDDYRYRGLNIRDEVILRTACGCEKLMSVPERDPECQVRIVVDEPTPAGAAFRSDAIYMLRRFRYRGERDRTGRRIMDEVVDAPYPWKARYEKLYNDVYGVDTGL